YGATAGLITMEDMLEEIVGEIRDEYDEDEEDLVKKLNATEFAVDAAMKLDDLNDQIGLNLESEDYDSIGGFVIGLLDHLPEEGEEVVYENLRLVVEKVERNRIETIHIYQMSEEELKERTEQAEAEIEE
ncbi:MAG: hemolysin, partial [Lachnospiraceae bacterium]|nr:hemolysin [Lachnospiraceae bacterium]